MGEKDGRGGENERWSEKDGEGERKGEMGEKDKRAVNEHWLPVLLACILNDHGYGRTSHWPPPAGRKSSTANPLSLLQRGRVLSGDDSAELIGLGLGLGAGLPLSVTKLEFHNTDRPLPPDRLSDSFWLMAVAQPLQQRAGDPTAWTLSDFYDYMSPDDNISAIEMTLDPEPTLNPPADIEDEKPIAHWPPLLPPAMTTPSPHLRVRWVWSGFVRSEVGGECVSQCDAQPDFCYNRGVCAIDTGIGAFCSLYRPQSEMQTDGFSVSMAPDSSHANTKKRREERRPPGHEEGATEDKRTRHGRADTGRERRERQRRDDTATNT
ncbi:unnamed protein product [Coregonus sp. 'balchen']|nr:unnamed protein product [Coregonus sp. 'balchen']